jgi:hypothetical protein
MERMTFQVEEIFEDIPGGWKEGDVLTIKVEDDAIVISKNG